MNQGNSMSKSNEALVQRIADAVAREFRGWFRSTPEKNADEFRLEAAIRSALSQQGEAVADGGVDCVGLALDLEARAKTVESQTTERAMLAAAHGLRLLASPAPKPQGEPVAQKVYGWHYASSNGDGTWSMTFHVGDSIPSWKPHHHEGPCTPVYAAPPAPAADELAGLREQLSNWQRAYTTEYAKNEELTEKLAASEARVGLLEEFLADCVKTFDWFRMVRGSDGALAEIVKKAADLTPPSNGEKA